MHKVFSVSISCRLLGNHMVLDSVFTALTLCYTSSLGWPRFSVGRRAFSVYNHVYRIGSWFQQNNHWKTPSQPTVKVISGWHSVGQHLSCTIQEKITAFHYGYIFVSKSLQRQRNFFHNPLTIQWQVHRQWHLSIYRTITKRQHLLLKHLPTTALLDNIEVAQYICGSVLGNHVAYKLIIER